MKILNPLKLALRNLEIPVLDLGQRYSEDGFIDFITVEDMSSPIMKGEDIYGRPFVAVKLQTKHTISGETAEMVGTFFQRYDNDFHTWAYASCYNPSLLYYNSRVYSFHYDFLQKRFEALLAGQVLRSFKDEIEDFVNGTGDVEVSLEQIAKTEKKIKTVHWD